MNGSWVKRALVPGLGLGGTPVHADDGTAAMLWPCVSILLALLLGGAALFCFILKKRLAVLQDRMRDQYGRTEDVQRRLDHALTSNEFRSSLFHGSAHELLAPLQGILECLRKLLQDRQSPFPEEPRRQLQKAIMLAESSRHHISSILDLSVGNLERVQLHSGPIFLPQLMLEIDSIAEALHLRYPDCMFENKKLWTHEHGAVFIHDHARILLMMRKLITHVFRLSKANERHRVVLAMGRRDQALAIDVSIQGSGGVSVEPGARSEKGSDFHGHDLTAFRILLDLMQGEMEISSEPQPGLRFSLLIPELPMAQGADAAPAGTPSMPPLEADSPTPDSRHLSRNLKQMDNYVHILVVDDNEVNREITRDILESQGYRVSQASGGREGLAAMHDDRPDLVLLDLVMPGMSGEEVLEKKHLDTALADIPVIMIMPRAEESDLAHGFELGANDYLSKPIVQQELIVRVRQLLSRQRLVKRMILMEDREKMAQLGEMVSDLLQEAREVSTYRHDADAGRQLCEETLQALPGAARLRAELMQAFLGAASNSQDIDLDALPLPEAEPAVLHLLRSLRLQLAPALASHADKIKIWQALQVLPERDLMIWDRAVTLAGRHMHLLEETQKSRLLLAAILETQPQRSSRSACRVDHTLSKVLSLLGPRLRWTAVKVSTNVPSQTLMITSGDLLQVCISLVTSMCRRLEPLLDQDKWLDISAVTFADHVLLRFACGGPRWSETQAMHLFDPWDEGTDASAIGLHVARKIVLGALGRLDFKSEAGANCFELELPRALSGIY